jgi:DHA2 family multidrug resistance protein
VESLLHQQAARLAAAGGDALNGVSAGLSMLHSLLMREALVLTFADTFYAVAVCLAVGFISVFFTHPFGVGSAPPVDAH